MSDRDSKNKMKKLLIKKIREKLKEETDNIMLNDPAKYGRYQFLQTLYEICHTKALKMCQSALTNLRNRGINEALSQFGEISQLGGFLSDLIEDASGGVKGTGEDVTTDD